MSNEQKLTPWFNGDVKPVRNGVYEQRVEMKRIKTRYSFWDGTTWRQWDEKPDGAATKERRIYTSFFRRYLGAALLRSPPMETDQKTPGQVLYEADAARRKGPRNWWQLTNGNRASWERDATAKAAAQALESSLKATLPELPEADGHDFGREMWDGENMKRYALAAIAHDRANQPAASGVWIPVSERLPEPKVSVLAYVPNWYGCHLLDHSGLSWIDEFGDPMDSHYVTHWMKLPETPTP